MLFIIIYFIYSRQSLAIGAQRPKVCNFARSMPSPSNRKKKTADSRWVRAVHNECLAEHIHECESMRLNQNSYHYFIQIKVTSSQKTKPEKGCCSDMHCKLFPYSRNIRIIFAQASESTAIGPNFEDLFHVFWSPIPGISEIELYVCHRISIKPLTWVWYK